VELQKGDFMRAFLIPMLVLGLAACQAAPPPPPNIPPPPPPSIELPPEAGFEGFNTPDLLSGKAYISGESSTNALTNGGAPAAFLLLSESDKGRARKICQSFERLNPVAPAGSEASDLKRVPVYWMYNAGQVPTDANIKKRCKKLVDGYNFARARELKRAWGLGDLKDGTYLIAHDGNPDTDQKSDFYIRIDAGTQKQMDDVMSRWFAVAAANPGSEGFEVVSNSLIAQAWRAFGCDAIGMVTDIVPMGGTVAGIVFKDGKCTAGQIV
jgi:hypothetical protein